MATEEKSGAVYWGLGDLDLMEEAAAGYVASLVSRGVDCLFLNPGTDTFPIQEALAKLQSLGRPVPRTVLCMFESVALSAAHGYYAATGRAQAVLVHVDVGTQNLGSMLNNAQRGRAAVVITAGRSPYTTDPNVRGSRDTYSQWLQEQMDQHAIVRNYTKWDYELRRSDQMSEAIARAFQMAESDPPGPTYLTLPREVLMETVAHGGYRNIERVPPVRFGAGDATVLRDVARRLVESQHPVVLTAGSGRSAAGYHGLVRLAELLALPIVERRNRANFPTNHVLHQGYDAVPFLETADLVLILDHDIPYLPQLAQPAADATVVQIDLDPIKDHIPLWSFAVDIPIRADTAKALDAIADEVEGLLTPDVCQRIEIHRAKYAEQHRRLVDQAREGALAARAQGPISPNWLSYCLGELAAEDPECIFVDESVTNFATVWSHVPIQKPESWFINGGSGLGWALGAALGIKLARPDNPIVALVGDGSFVFSAPLAALWATKVESSPILVVIFNNSRYAATKNPLMASYPDGYSISRSEFVGVDLSPAPRYDLLAAAVDAYGEQIVDPEEVLPALRRGLERVRSGQTAIIDVHIA